ncbi:MAG TPA: hypothetical protein VK646_06705 [Actinomycetota bacterium]|nr:hypothetical protein [Actinomycetota bacterium]
MLRLTDRAREALLASQSAARRFDPSAHVRLLRVGGRLRTELVDAAEPGDEVVHLDGLDLFVQAGIVGTVDAAEHNELTLDA